MAELELSHKQELCDSLHTHGYAIVDASPRLAALLQQLSSEAATFFSLEEGEKAKVCCEYISRKNSNDYRDRLEVSVCVCINCFS
jgi:isopenicillin N synthase-like dioxygenase